MYGLYGVGIPVSGPPRCFEGRSKKVVLVAGALCCGYASRKGKDLLDDAEGDTGDRFKGAGVRERPEGDMIGALACNRGNGATGGGPGL